MRFTFTRKAWKFFPRLVKMLLLIAFFSGCNFFGKKAADPAAVPGQLPDGNSVVGVWSVSSEGMTSTRNPTDAVTQTYTFDPTGSMRVEIRDPHLGGAVCTGYGQYHLSQSDLMLYIQAVSAPGCAFSSIIHWSSVKVLAKSLQFVDPTTNHTYNYFMDNPQGNAPVGLWDFHSAGASNTMPGIDNIFMDEHGYFIMQLSDNGALDLIIGSYKVANGTLTFQFFSDLDPTHADPNEIMEFPEFATDGQSLQLLGTDSTGNAVLYNGTRL